MQGVIPTLLYAAETWMLTKTLGCMIRSTQIKTERKMLGVTMEGKITNNTIREKASRHTANVIRMEVGWACSKSYR